MPGISGWRDIRLMDMLAYPLDNCSRKLLSFWIFEDVFYCSVIKVLCIAVFCDNSDIISYLFLTVNTFFHKKCHFFSLAYCSAKYEHCSLKSGEGGIWTLAPRKRPTPLAGAPLQPLEYFSKCLNLIMIWGVTYLWRIDNYTKKENICQRFLWDL